MAPTVADQASRRASEAATSASSTASAQSSKFTRWVEDNRNALLGIAAGVGVAGLAYYLYTASGSSDRGPPGSPSGRSATAGSGSADKGASSSSKKKNKKKKAAGGAGASAQEVGSGDGPLVQELSSGERQPPLLFRSEAVADSFPFSRPTHGPLSRRDCKDS
jgi:hypothetical protein